MNDSFFLNIVSPEKEVYSGRAKIINLPGTKGRFAVLPLHAPLVSTLRQGEINFVSEDGKQTILNILSGMIEVHNNEVTVCVELI